MKKIISILVALLLIGTLTGCGNEERNTDSESYVGTEETEKESESSSETESEAEVETETESETETETETESETETETETETATEKAFEFSVAPEDDGNTLILLDAGHGFDDGGCTSPNLKGLHEKDIAMILVLKAKTALENKGYTVMLTHDGKSFPKETEIMSKADEYGIVYKPDKIYINNIFSAYERTIYSDVLCIENDIDLFVSIHVNSNPDTDTVTGFMIDYCAENPFSDQSAKLTDSLISALNSKFEGRPLVRFADSWAESFIVTKYVLMPSVLIESGYASTPSDAEKLLDEEWQNNFAEAVCEGIVNYIENHT